MIISYHPQKIKREIFLTKVFFSLIISAICSYTSLSAGPLDAFKGMKGRLDIVGGTAHLPIMSEVVDAIQKYNPAITISLSGGGSGLGVQRLVQDLADIGNTGRPLSATELSKYTLRSVPFAIEGLALIGHKSNPINSLTREQAQKIFAGSITNWEILGGKPGPIRLYLREQDSGTRQILEEYLGESAKNTPSNIIVVSNGAMKLAIERDPSGLGYIGAGFLDGSVKSFSINGISPEPALIKSKRYPIIRELFMNTRRTTKPLTEAFVQYMLTETAQATFSKFGLIPITQQGQK